MTRRTELAAQAAAATAVLLVLAAGSLVTRHHSEHQATDAPVAARAGPRLLVESVLVESYPEGIWVYNCTVEGDHTFYVGTARGGAWVYNANCGDFDFIQESGHSCQTP